MELDITKKPKANALDVAYHALKIALSAAGQVSGLVTGVPLPIPASEFMSALLEPPVAKRRNEWMELLARRIVEVENQIAQFKIEDLPNNENFISAVIQASHLAIRTHKKEKLEALANAVVNTAMSNTVDDDIQFVFLHLIDRVTPSHMILLKYFDNPHSWRRERNAHGAHMMDGWIENFDESFPDFAGKRHAFYWTIRDLINLELLREKPDDSYKLSRLLGRAPGAKPESVEREEKAARKDNLKSRNLIDIMNLEVTILGQAFLLLIANPIERSSSSKP